MHVLLCYSELACRRPTSEDYLHLEIKNKLLFADVQFQMSSESAR
jgi:hypothetical protein